MLTGLIVLGLVYQRVKNPAFWTWMTNESRAQDQVSTAESSKPSAAPASEKTPAKNEQAEVIIPGPNETDPDELAAFRSHLKVIQDREPLQPHEMPAYWQLMRWSRTRPFSELEKLARRDVPYSHLWDEPGLYRGQPIRLKLHVRRVLTYDAPANPLGLSTVYEAWGWTDDSRSFPFVVVFPEKPAGVPLGTDVDADIVFVGYFVKWMSYRAFDTKKNSPLLVGRVKPAQRAVGGATGNEWESAFLVLVAVVLVLGGLGWFGLRTWNSPRTRGAAMTATSEQLPDNWLAGLSAANGASANAKPAFDVNSFSLEQDAGKSCAANSDGSRAAEPVDVNRPSDDASP
jgi:hypothetical protein